MKCPKCKYTTFDFLETCPRCGKDISPERAKLNISSIKPNPPFLLGSLTGDLNDSAFAMKVPEADEPPLESMSMELKADDIYDDGSELNIDMDEKLPPEPTSSDFDLGDLDSAEGDEDLELNFGIEDSGPGLEQKPAEDRNSITKSSNAKGGEVDRDTKKADSGNGSHEIELDLEDLELNIDLDEDIDFKK